MTDPLHQQVYDTVAHHLIAQGRAATYDSISWYRGLNNQRCAIGCLIPDDKYTPFMEGCAVRSLVGKFPKALPPVDSALLQTLQVAHDITLAEQGIRSWAERMIHIARDWELDPKIISTFLENPDD